MLFNYVHLFFSEKKELKNQKVCVETMTRREIYRSLNWKQFEKNNEFFKVIFQ